MDAVDDVPKKENLRMVLYQVVRGVRLADQMGEGEWLRLQVDGRPAA